MKSWVSDPSIAFVSTYPPTVCGLANFTASLLGAISENRGARDGLGVVALADSASTIPIGDVVYRHERGNQDSLDTAIKHINAFDVVSIQHEFGIFGGTDGDEAVEISATVEVPAVVTFHTVLNHPSDHQRAIVERLALITARSVVMSRTALHRLTGRYGIDPDRVEVIPHGADARFNGPSLASGDRPLVLTWGLIGPGKGLETSIEAFAGLTDLYPLPRYLIAGATHPNVRESHGESYRDSLVALVHELGLGKIVEFDDRYLDRVVLARLVRSADLVVLPYESIEQVTSGVLVEAIAASKPVIATAFPHALELLAGGAGITVPHGDPAALGAALRSVLTDGRLAARMERHTRRLKRGRYWPSIGQRYDMLMSTVAFGDRSAANHPVGIQHVAG
ncbi:MAG TPA: glycosyltransferase [Acidimicrobiia bacterium]|nr:glycosyltransferase [Acidimicrobiia bacterium]